MGVPLILGARMKVAPLNKRFCPLEVVGVLYDVERNSGIVMSVTDGC